jgi:hypothetical protein
MTRPAFLAQMNAREEGLLMALERIDGPFGNRQTELRTARQTAAIAAALGGGDQPVVNHMPGWYQNQPDVIEAGRRPQDIEQMKAAWNTVAIAWNRPAA